MSDDALRLAAEAVVRAMRDAGPEPRYHAAVMQRHQDEWPVLWHALRRLAQAVDGAPGGGGGRR